MRKFLKQLFLVCFMTMVSLSLNAKTNDKTFDWTEVINAIIKVESNGNPNAVNGNGSCVGIMQITPIAVKACNLILKERKSPKRYTLSDRNNPTKSKEMFILLQSKFNPSNNVDDGIRMWNCGISALKDKSKGRKYLNKVKKYMNGGK